MTTLSEEIISSVHYFLENEVSANELAENILKLFEKMIDSTEEEVKKQICDDEDGLIDYGVGKLADTLREELKK